MWRGSSVLPLITLWLSVSAGAAAKERSQARSNAESLASVKICSIAQKIGQLIGQLIGHLSGSCSRQFAIFIIALGVYSICSAAEFACKKPVYLTLDTGHMGVANFMADVLRQNDVKVTFFAAQERTQQGDGSLGTHWAPWWKARAAEGHSFATHTYDHVLWRGDVRAGLARDGLGSGAAGPAFRMRPSAGPRAGQELVLSAADYCSQLTRASDRLREVTGTAPLPLFRAPGGKTSPALLTAAKTCGYAHVGWATAGFLGDELPSEKFSNERLLNQALSNIRSGDILVAHLGIWSRKDPWAPAVLEPLIVGLKARGFCFSTLREHPDYRNAKPLPVG